ncbi:protein adenylyltransferase SelO family protein [Arcobacter sp. CECT 8985]|uniref:protein adenylyltransferase SelO family protein n=1 Tax=Arcobacter sp. CECT 8985 TaxID=1935424 RepID=UPI00100BB054|nr:protein adenylyltransferase SelO family protein [Arcobacter sp. CECT 8985]RXJ84569.1 hypothetical protein CRU93_12425 [Arcobacter sp. CECT 8985]
MKVEKQNKTTIKTLSDLAKVTDYSLMNNLNCDLEATSDGEDYYPREVFSGHFVPVKPTPMQNPEYISHSKTLFNQLGFDESFAKSDKFISMFSGDLSNLPESMSKVGWATGYALSIYGKEYYEQCPFQTGNAYGDGRAISVVEVVNDGKRWEMQLKGAGKTPYCRGADGRAVLRSSVREFLAQEHMYGLGVPTSRSLSLITSKTQKVTRPWYQEDSNSFNPDIMVSENIAISTRVAPSFLRVGQLELFARRARKNEHSKAKEELEKIVLHIIKREYNDEISDSLSLEQKVIVLAQEFCHRLTKLVANWLRVGYCQGNFNSDNCAVGGFTLDYGPFGFTDIFDPNYQSWTGGGQHFAFYNQPVAAQRNFGSFCESLKQLLLSDEIALKKLDNIKNNFSKVMEKEVKQMWANKLGLETFDSEIFDELEYLMCQTVVDYTIFFRELSNIPKSIESLKKSFYKDITLNNQLQNRWSNWLENWRLTINTNNILNKDEMSSNFYEELSKQMKQINPKYILREWILAPAYKNAQEGDYSLIKELQEIMIKPYDEHSDEIEKKYYKLKPREFFNMGGISHMSCSS